MPLGSFRNGRLLVSAGLLVFAGGLAICKATPVCSWSATPAAKTPQLTSTRGENSVILAQKKRQVQHVNETDFARLVLNSEVPVLVDFYADWCGPCRRLTSVLEELAAEMPEAMIVKVNVDDSPNLAAEYGVEAIPNVKVFRNGNVTGEQVGLATKRELRALLTE